MEKHISGLANPLTFSVADQLITWNNYTIAVGSISTFFTGVSTSYCKNKQKKRGIFYKLGMGSSMLITLAQMISADASERAKIIDASFAYYFDDEHLPCINLILMNDTTLEITFTDMMTFCEAVSDITKAIVEHTERNNLEMRGTDILVDKANFHGEAFFIEEVKK